ncbi:MAG: hypothetical protein ACOC2P_03965 [Spirochaetota bacterium]
MKKLLLLFAIPLLFGTLLLGCNPAEQAPPPQEGQEPMEQQEDTLE